MVCPKCGSNNVNVSIQQKSAKTKQKRMGCLWSIGRACLIVCTLGLWLLVGRRSGTATTKFESETVAVCQQCAYKWVIKN